MHDLELSSEEDNPEEDTPEEEEADQEAAAEATEASMKAGVVLIANRRLEIVTMSPFSGAGRGDGAPNSQSMEPVKATRGKAWLYVEIDGEGGCADDLASTQKAANHLTAVRGALAVVDRRGRLALLICKRRFQELDVPVGWRLFALKRGSSGRVFELMERVVSGSLAYCSSLRLRERSKDLGPMTLERVVEALAAYSDDDLTLLVGNARLKPPLERSDLEVVLTRCWCHIRSLRARRGAAGLVREAGMEQPKPLPFHRFNGVARLMGSGWDPTAGEAFTVSYEQFLSDPKLHLHYAACLLGSAGFGKTPLARSTAVYLAASYQAEFYQTPPARCYFIQANSIDCLRSCQLVLKSYVPLFIDEFEATDSRQQGILGPNSLKALCDVANGGTLRVRYGTIVIPENCPRIFAANVPTPDEWLQKLGSDPNHKPAILKRVLFFPVTEPMVQAASQEASGDEADRQSALRRALPAGRQFLEGGAGGVDP